MRSMLGKSFPKAQFFNVKVFVLFCFIFPSMQSRAIYLLFYIENALLTVVHPYHPPPAV